MKPIETPDNENGTPIDPDHIQVIRVKRENVIETYLAFKTPGQFHSDAFARVTAVIHGINFDTYNANPVCAIEYLQPGEPTYDMMRAAHMVQEDIENEFTNPSPDKKEEAV